MLAYKSNSAPLACRLMTIGERIELRRKAIGIKSQAELARRAGVGQSTLSGLIRKPYRWSPYLVGIARELQTTVEFLTGATDDPDAGAPPPTAEPTIQFVTMAVALPPERALARMFEGLLRAMDREAPLDEQARLLAQRLPIGLSQLRDLLPAAPIAAEAKSPSSRPIRAPEPQR